MPVQFDGKDDTRQKDFICRFGVGLVSCVCGGLRSATASAPPRSPPQEARTPNVKPLDPNQAARLQRIMVPLLRAGDQTRSLKQIRLGVVEDQNINAANAGGGSSTSQRGCFRRQMTGSWRGILAHEIAHDDLGHVAKAQVLGTGLNLGIILLEQIIPGSSAITPIAGTLVARAYSRSEELEADQHAVEILQRAGYSKEVMIDALAWVMQSSPANGGGFLSTHPATKIESPLCAN